MNGVSRVNYDYDLNLLYLRRGDKSQEFLKEKGQDAIMRFLKFTLSGVEAANGDAHLTTCLWTVHSLGRRYPLNESCGGLTLLVFPKFGEISRYVLCQDNFMSNALCTSADPIVIGGLPVKINLDTSSNAVYLSREKSSLPNLITGALLFKRTLNRENYIWLSEVRGIIT